MSKLKRISEANVELTQKLNFAVNQNRELLNCVAAILMEHHAGKVNISPHHVTQTKGWAVNVQAFQSLGLVQVRAISPEQVHAAMKPRLTEVARMPEPEPERPLACADAWHMDADAQGLMCGQCGSKQKLATCAAAIA